MYKYEIHSRPDQEDEAATVWLQNHDGSRLVLNSILLAIDVV